MGLTPPHSLLVPKVPEKSVTIPLLTLRACMVYKGVKTYLKCNKTVVRKQDNCFIERLK